MRGFLYSILWAMLGIFLSLVLSAVVGENPINVFKVMISGSLGSFTNIGYTLYYATPLILTGFAVSWALQTGLFNIGAEGQMNVGALCATTVALTLPDLPFPISLFATFFAAGLGGSLWGALAGWLKAYRGAHEVLATILLNIISAGIVGYIVNHLYKNPTSQNPETLAFAENYFIPKIFWLGGQSPLNVTLFVALLVTVIFSFISQRSLMGFRNRMTGDAPGLALHSGVNVKRQIFISMALSGAIAGLAGLSEVFGYSGKLKEGFSAGAGFTGIAVALLGRHHPVGIIGAALLFGMLHKGSLDLDIDTEFISRDFSLVIQALIILFVASEKGLSGIFRRKNHG